MVGYHGGLLRILDSKGLATNSYVKQGSYSSELFLLIGVRLEQMEKRAEVVLGMHVEAEW